jgi:DNA (cytosine-5)-methyltransferase 1
VSPTLVATDVSRFVVPDGNGLRRLTLREGLRLFGFPEDYELDIPEGDGFDLLGNSISVPVVKSVSERLLDTI